MKSSARIAVVHWSRAEALERVSALGKLGYEVSIETEFSPAKLKEFAAFQLDAIVIDLSRRPSHGRDVGGALRRQKATRLIPLVFVGGDPDKIEAVKALMPDARYTDWPQIEFVLQNAIQEKPREVVVPGTMAGYSGTPLPKKLGIRPDSSVVLLGAPDGFLSTLDGARIERKGAVVVLFAKSQAELTKRFTQARKAMLDGGRLWIAWPKKASGMASDLAEPDIRAFGMAAGLVDFKICAIDETWSGLCFAVRK